jgi:hypothetical protein
MRVLVTGGAGFIGSRFVRRLLDSGDEVVVLDKLTYAGSRDNLEGVPHTFYEADIADAETVAAAAAGCEAINVRELRQGSRWGYNRGFDPRRSRSLFKPFSEPLTAICSRIVLTHPTHADRPPFESIAVSARE